MESLKNPTINSITTDFCEACRVSQKEFRELVEKKQLLADENTRNYFDLKLLGIRNEIKVGFLVLTSVLTIVEIVLRVFLR